MLEACIAKKVFLGKILAIPTMHAGGYSRLIHNCFMNIINLGEFNWGRDGRTFVSLISDKGKLRFYFP